MTPSPSLRDATVQDIQLELIRRTAFNAFDGERVCESLLRHRGLWEAVLLDQPGLPNYLRPGSLLMNGLIKLRDLLHNTWNADTLFVLTRTADAARELARIAKVDRWGGEVRIHDDQSELNNALGVSSPEYGLLSVWWD